MRTLTENNTVRHLLIVSPWIGLAMALVGILRPEMQAIALPGMLLFLSALLYGMR